MAQQGLRQITEREDNTDDMWVDSNSEFQLPASTQAFAVHHGLVSARQRKAHKYL